MPSVTADGPLTSDHVTTVHVPLGERAYDVYVGAGVRSLLPGLVTRLGATRAAVVTPRPEDWTPDTGVPTTVVTTPDGEAGKTLANLETVCRSFAQHGLTRHDVVVSVGGGSVTDLAGLAAALYHRGVPVIHLPTSLLAQVDASVGGKTAVNLPEAKNLVGTYWQPAAVLCDTDFLATLPPREWASGYGEIARAHFIGTGDLRGWPVTSQIATSVAMKAAIVAADERDTGGRHRLNYGHTLGHALEVVTGFRLRHGEAVAVGTVFAGRLAWAAGRIAADRADEHEHVVRNYGLPTELPADADADALIAVMRRDKKSDGGLTFVLDGPDGPELVPDVPETLVRQTLAGMPRVAGVAG